MKYQKHKVTQGFVDTLIFLRLILTPKYKSNINKLILCLNLLQKYFVKRRYKLVHVDDSIFVLMCKTAEVLSQRNHIILVNNCDFRNHHYKWTLLQFYKDSYYHKRFFFIVPSSKLLSNTMAVTDVAFSNLKSSLKINHFFRFCAYFNIEKSLNSLDPSQASKVVISFLNNNMYFPPGTLTKIVSNYLKCPRFIYHQDVCCINLRLYWNQYHEGYLYFKVNQIEGQDCKNDLKVYSITEATSIYDEAGINYNIPSMGCELINYQNIDSISTTLPLGLEVYYCSILKWFYPFFLNHVKELKPVFTVTGPCGVGKTLILKAVSKSLGVYYKRVDCNNILASSVTQIKANVLNAFKEAKNHSPSILHLSHAELLSTELGSSDPNQVAEAFYENLKNLSSKEKVMIVLTCSTIESLESKFNNLALQTLHINYPNENERRLMIIWLVHRHNLPIKNSVINFASSESTSFTISDLTKMLWLSNKRRFQDKEKITIEEHHIKWFLDQKKEKGKITEVEWEDVGGVDKLKREVLGSLMSSKLIPGLERRGLLLHGPPGTGKTLLARAVASQCNRTFIPVKGPELLNMYFGQSEANLRQVFQRAREESPSILFFDELDSLAPNRGNKSDSGGVMDRVVSQLLSEMDGLENNSDVFILAATNRPDLIDPSLLRPGRFDKMLYVGPCEDNESKEKVMKAITRKFKLGHDVDIADLMSLMPKQITGAIMYGICSLAWMEAARELIDDPNQTKNSNVVVGRHHFEKALVSMNL